MRKGLCVGHCDSTKCCPWWLEVQWAPMLYPACWRLVGERKELAWLVEVPSEGLVIMQKRWLLVEGSYAQPWWVP